MEGIARWLDNIDFFAKDSIIFATQCQQKVQYMKEGNAMQSQRHEGFFVRAMRRTRLQSRLLVSCLLLALIPVLIVGLYAYRVYTDSINRNLGQSVEQAVRLLNTAVVSELGKFTAYINTISVSDTVQSILTRPESERVLPDGSVALAIKQLVQETPAQSNYLKNIRVVDRTGNVLYDLGFDDIPAETFAGLIASVEDASPDDSLLYVRTYRGVDTLVLGRKIYQFAKPTQHIGYILVYIREALLSGQLFANIDFGAGSHVLLMGGKGQVLSSRDGTLLGTSFGGADGLLHAVSARRARGENQLDAQINGVDSLVVFDYSPAIDAYFIASIPQAVVTAETRQITGRLLLVAAVTMLVSAALAVLIYRSIILPVRRVVRFCEEATQAAAVPAIGDGSADELGFLSRAIDRFADENRQLLQQSKQDERRKRALELEMLQYQINPHFLFNTLNTLKWVAVLNEVPVLEEGISSLSQLLQSTLLHTEASIPLRAELENVRHYIAIQKIRYADCFEVGYAVDPSLEAVPVPRFILQPLVENAILHGTREDGRSITITIGAARLRSGDIALTVRDDGQGFEASDLRDSGRERFSGIGLRNVDDRIRLDYGEAYGLAIDSVPGEGTLCTITLREKASAQEAEQDA